MSWVAATGLLSVGILGYAYTQYNMAIKRKATVDAYETSTGEAQVGGPFTLTDTNGKPFSSSQLEGEFSMLYFGFTHCPDICPEELEKMADALNKVGAIMQSDRLLPLCDPDRRVHLVAVVRHASTQRHVDPRTVPNVPIALPIASAWACIGLPLAHVNHRKEVGA
jgi:cytochrome oxidase Cu insertion factor (SCO1/SenC/PrrC family)